MDLSPEDDNFPGRLLHQAALWDNAELVEDLVIESTEEELNSTDCWGRTALHAAAACEHSRCLPVLLKAGANPNIACGTRDNCKTPLHICAERGDSINIKELLAAGADWNQKDISGNTPLLLAELCGHTPAAKLLKDAQEESEQLKASRHAELRAALISGSSLRTPLSTLGTDAGLIVNMAPAGANTLLFTAAEMGLVDAVRALVASGADGRSHPVTRYSPLYVACYHGNKDIAETLLLHFPEMAQQQTVERWLPLHACCINGHAELVSLLLNFPYPEKILKTFRNHTEEFEYQAAFDINHRDVSGQTALYVACLLGNRQIVDILMKHTVRAVKIVSKLQMSDTRTEPSTPISAKNIESEILSPTRRRISDGIQSILSKLSLGNKQHDSIMELNSELRIKPVHLDVVIGVTRDTCLRAAVRGRHVDIAQVLLVASADPNAPCAMQHPTSHKASMDSNQSHCSAYSSSSNVINNIVSVSATTGFNVAPEPISLPALVEACKSRDHGLVELLLKHGANDLNCSALKEAIIIGDETLISRLLSIKAYPDPEYKINKRGMTESMSLNGLLNPGSDAQAIEKSSSPSHRRAPLLTYSAMFPSQPAMLNWHNQSCRISSIKMSWIQEAAMHVNPKLRSSPRGRAVALHAVTRLDLSGNALTSIPVAILQMTSLRYLNVAQNKLEKLPSCGDSSDSVEQQPTRGRRSRRSDNNKLNTEECFTAPVLEEIYLQENRLENLPDALFSLSSLTTLDVSNNKLRKLPYSIWRAPRLRDMNVSLNLLKDLPTRTEHVSICEEAILKSPSESYEKRIPLSNSSGQLSASSNSSVSCNSNSSLNMQRRSWSVDRVTGMKVDSSRESFFGPDALDEESLPSIKKVEGVIQQDLRKHHLWTRGLEISERPPDPPPTAKCSRLAILNLSHNQFTSIPAGLPCLAPSLSRLNMSFNALRSMSHVTNYPNSLKLLDLSHNQITCWPSLPQVDNWGPLEQANVSCYCPGSNGAPKARARSASGVRKAVLAALCPARRHLRLDGLRTLILADNLLTRIQLTTDDDGGEILDGSDRVNVNDKPIREVNTSTEDDEDWYLLPVIRSRLLFPNLSMLDVSNNMLKFIPTTIHELTNLSVLNISGNTEISELPPQMGLLNRLWNLNTLGCPLQEPLRSMIDSKKYKTMDIIGYLKSVLEDAKPYARMKLMIVGIQGIGKTSLLEKLRQESAPAHRRRPPEHWAKRMGNKNVNTKTSRGINMSTVGVDIGDWIYDRHPARNGRSGHGPVVFKTWDFGGQKEYYSTHQYFLSRRSLYIVVWRVIDGIAGLAGIQHWLVSIQARAPNSPVIIVGTHYDSANDMPGEQSPEQLQRLIRERFISISDPEKRGLPRVLDSVEVSCTTRHNIRLLANLIYDMVFSLRQPGSKELLLEQRIPASYLTLEDAVGIMAAERKARGLDPVITHEQFKHQVAQYMQQKFHRNFRDQAELHQATMFLHDNGVLLHYDDATLKDLYFLDPQWLCDMLAHVVTVREINPFARMGVMRLEDLHLLFKSSRAGDSRDYVVSLLNKFEVALSWDGRSLLLPPLLPTAEAPLDGMGINNHVKIPMKTKAWTGRGHKKIAVSPLSILNQGSNEGVAVPMTVPYGPTMAGCSTHGRSHPQHSIRRLLIASYSPCGFWPRLITRLLADDTVSDVVDNFYTVPEEFAGDTAVIRVANLGGEWWPWQAGMRLFRSNVLLLTIREVPQEHQFYRGTRFRLKQEGIWNDVDTSSSSILEIVLPADEMIVKRPIIDEQGETIGYQNICIEPSLEAMAKLLVIVVDHIDILLEDWYPTLGTRFVHTSEGRFLVTRLIPCPQCLLHAETANNEGNTPKSNENNDDHVDNISVHLEEAFKRAPRDDLQSPAIRPRASQESCTSDGDSGVDPDSTGSSRMPSMEGVAGHNPISHYPAVHTWTIEECILYAGSSAMVICPIHQEIKLSKIAPDVMFLDLGPHRLAYSKDLNRGALIGRGAFGLVFRTEWQGRGSVALKVLQPVPPGPRAPPSALAAYKAATARWDRDPMQAACRAYLSARGEMGVLLPLRHPNVAPFLAACTSPLALVLALAPMGALDGVLRGYKQSGARLGPHCAQAVAVQAARALEYLHRQRIIYRDLKAENVLVWEMPPPVGPFKDHPDLPVHIKVADYGISRLTLPSGTKGFGGTEGFMAPEIMRYNGEEEYTEKVDCFSFGMFLYELLTLRQPFEGHEAVKECVLEGGRPALTHKETMYPCYMLDLMVACWSGQPELRPSASQIVSIASAPEFTHLTDVVSLHHTADVTHSSATQITNISEGVEGWEIWVARAHPRCDILSVAQARWLHYHALPIPNHTESASDEPILPMVVCSVGNSIWIGDSVGQIHAYNSTDCRHIFTYSLESKTSSCQVAALLHLPSLARVAAALSNGRLFLLDNNEAPLSPTAGEGTFVMTELGAATALHCLTAVETDEYCEIWCGGDAGGGISVYRMVANFGAAGAQELPCPVPAAAASSRVLHAVASTHTVCTYLYPGCVIYQWDAVEKCLLAKLDCSKLVPCSESLRSISIEEHLSPGRCQVTSLAILNDNIYVGTTWGCIIIAERDTLRPITIFRPYEEEVRAIIPLPMYRRYIRDDASISDSQSNGENYDEMPLIATIGRGYRSLLTRYTETVPQYGPSANAAQNSNVMHCLLWRGEHWAVN